FVPLAAQAALPAQQAPPASSAQDAPRALPAQEPAPVTVGAGPGPVYTWVRDWGRLPDGKELGSTHGCLVVDADGNVLANTETDHAVVVFSPDGKVLRAWGKEFRGGLHGMCLV